MNASSGTTQNIRDRALEILRQQRGAPITMVEAVKTAQAEKYKDRNYQLVENR